MKEFLSFMRENAAWIAPLGAAVIAGVVALIINCKKKGSATGTSANKSQTISHIHNSTVNQAGGDIKK